MLPGSAVLSAAGLLSKVSSRFIMLPQRVPNAVLPCCWILLLVCIPVSLAPCLLVTWMFPPVAVAIVPCSSLGHGHIFDFLWAWTVKKSLSGFPSLIPFAWEFGLRESHCVRSEGPVCYSVPSTRIWDSTLSVWQWSSCFLLRTGYPCPNPKLMEISPRVQLSLPCSLSSVTQQEMGIGKTKLFHLSLLSSRLSGLCAPVLAEWCHVAWFMKVAVSGRNAAFLENSFLGLLSGACQLRIGQRRRQ